jgi:hypothetical protein
MILDLMISLDKTQLFRQRYYMMSYLLVGNACVMQALMVSMETWG